MCEITNATGHELEPGMIIQINTDNKAFNGEFIVTRDLNEHRFKIIRNRWYNRLRYFLHLC